LGLHKTLHTMVHSKHNLALCAFWSSWACRWLIYSAKSHCVLVHSNPCSESWLAVWALTLVWYCFGNLYPRWFDQSGVVEIVWCNRRQAPLCSLQDSLWYLPHLLYRKTSLAWQWYHWCVPQRGSGQNFIIHIYQENGPVLVVDALFIVLALHKTNGDETTMQTLVLNLACLLLSIKVALKGQTWAFGLDLSNATPTGISM
jgi:hypothetical protein